MTLVCMASVEQKFFRSCSWSDVYDHCFPDSKHILCTRHLDENVRRKLRHDIGASDSSVQAVINDIFGKSVTEKTMICLVVAIPVQINWTHHDRCCMWCLSYQVVVVKYGDGNIDGTQIECAKPEICKQLRRLTTSFVNSWWPSLHAGSYTVKGQTSMHNCVHVRPTTRLKKLLFHRCHAHQCHRSRPHIQSGCRLNRRFVGLVSFFCWYFAFCTCFRSLGAQVEPSNVNVV
jgi:hypothetical protein